jgi:hypothetical protein
MKIHLIKSKTPEADSGIDYIETACGAIRLIRVPSKYLTEDYKKVTCGQCTQTKFYKGLKNE